MAGNLRRLSKWCAAGLVVAGVALATVLAWELWGTAIENARHQRRLAAQFLETASVPADDTEVFADPGDPPTERGEVVGRIESAAIGLDAYVVHGTRYRDLVRGPGWVSGTAYPGGPGNAAISGHRTSYGAPFADIHRLEPGDEIVVTVGGRASTYLVTGSSIVWPDETSVLRTDDWSRSTLTLISCHPKYSSKKRIIVTAEQRDWEPPGDVTEFAVDADDGLVVGDAADFGASPFETARGIITFVIWVLVVAMGASIVGTFVLSSRAARAPSPDASAHH